MKIVDKFIVDIIQYENNPRNNDKAVEPVANSIKNFGFRVPVIIDKNNVIVTGHTRVLAAKELNMDKVPCIVADDLTEEQVQAFRLADNKVSEFSDWDFSKLEEELMQLTGFDIDMESFGFDMSEFESMLEETQKENKEIDVDSFEDGNFTHTCPKCGFVWNDENE